MQKTQVTYKLLLMLNIIDLEGKVLSAVKKVNLTDSIIRQLISYIQAELQPGEKLLSERQLIDLLGVGRTSLRESLRALEVLGFVETRAGEGSFVAKTEGDYLRKPIELGVFCNSKSIREIYDARRVIELGMISLVVKNIDAESIEQCRRVLNKMKKAVDFSGFLNYDKQFHRIIAATTGNSILMEVLKLTHRILEEERRKSEFSEHELRKSISVHSGIIDAFENRDEQLAYRAVKEHMDWTKVLIKL
jgi:GntR family transcriptional regulator, transcriptional repressor for pyruvate dehydrogenase complex